MVNPLQQVAEHQHPLLDVKAKDQSFPRIGGPFRSAMIGDGTDDGMFFECNLRNRPEAVPPTIGWESGDRQRRSERRLARTA
jgi:hypothetical protein